MPLTTVAPTRASRSKYQADDWAGSIRTRTPFMPSSACASSPGFIRVTSSPSQPGSSLVTLAGSRNSIAVPLAATMAWARGRGDRITSPPRTLNSQAIDDGAVRTQASAPAAAIAAPMRARFEALPSPEYRSSWGTTGAAGWAGRASAQASSTGF